MKPYNESFIKCVEGLMERFWIFRDSDEELYLRILDYEKDLREYFNEQFRFKLVVKPEFIKLEKIRENYYNWMNIDAFKNTREFVMFYCLLSFLDRKVNQQFTLEDVCQFIVGNYPNEQIVWVGAEGYRNRLCLIQVLKYATEMRLLLVIDRDIDGFKGSYSHEVLFEGTQMIKYYMRGFSFNIQEVVPNENFTDRDKESHRILNEIYKKQTEEEKGIRVERKHRVYRKLFIEPVVYQNELDEDEMAYIKQYGYTIRDHVDKYTHMQYEQYNESILLVQEEEYSNSYKKSYPEAKVISKIAVQLGTHLRKEFEQNKVSTEDNGSIFLSSVDFRDMLQRLKEKERNNWTKTYQDMSINELKKDVLDYLVSWKMAAVIGDNEIILYDTIARVTGEYETKLIK